MNQIPLLTADQIEVKVKKITEKGSIALLYKTARVDMEILDEVFGALGWKCSYREIKGNLYCTISVWDEKTGQWIDKEDCGIESREDDEGNQKKGEASDAFKRAGFKWGIGRELYSSPFVFISAENAPTENKNGKWGLKNPFTNFTVKQIQFDEDRRISMLTISDGKKLVFVYGQGKKEPEPKPQAEPEAKTADEATGEVDPESQIPVHLYKFLQVQILDPDNKVDPQRQLQLQQIYKRFGYKKASEIKMKDYKAIVDELMGKLPWDE